MSWASVDGNIRQVCGIQVGMGRVTLFDDISCQGCLVIDAQSVVVVESGVQSNQKDGGSNHPKHGSSCASKEKQRDGNDSDSSVLLGKGDLFASKHHFLGLVPESSVPASTSRHSHGNEQEWGRDEAIDEQDYKYKHIVRLEVFDVLVESMCPHGRSCRHVEIGRSDKASPWPDQLLAFGAPLPDDRGRDVDLRRQIHGWRQAD